MAKDAKAPEFKRGMVADARNDITIPFFSKVLQPTDDTLIKRGGSKGLALYDEIERDTHAWAVLQKRKKTLVAREWEVEAGGEDQIDIDAADFVRAQLNRIAFDRMSEDLLDATLKGFAISEVIWERDAQHIIPKRVISHDQRRFVFDTDWRPRLLTMSNMTDGEELPPRKFIVHRHGVKGNNPYGLGLGTRLFWPVLFKREGITYWLTFLEKFASPTVISEIPFGLPDDVQSALLQTLEGIVQSTAATVPIGTMPKYLEASRSGSVSYEDWCKYWDKQLSVATLGETLTTDIGDNGSKAASQTHAEILELLVDADGDLLADTLQATLLTWMIEYNFAGAKVPKVWRVRSTNEVELAKLRLERAKASSGEHKAIREILSSAAKIDDDKEAERFIVAMAPRQFDDQIIDDLVASRHAFLNMPIDAAQEPEDDQPKKKLKISDPSEFADSDKVSTQDTIVAALYVAGDEFEQQRLEQIKDSLYQVTNFDAAAKALLDLQSIWNSDEFAALLGNSFQLAKLLGREAVNREMDGDLNADSFAEPEVIGQSFKEQIDYLQQKAPRPTAAWTDIMRGDHDRAFVIAGAKDRDMLKDFQNALLKSRNEGKGYREFLKDFDDIVGKYGWSYNGERGWRSKVIYETNIRTSYMAGRLKQMRDPAVVKTRPYWQYRHGVTRKPKIARRQHLAWHGLILPHDDTFWLTHYAPNDWKCSCGVRTLSKHDLQRLGKSEPDKSPNISKEPYLDKTTNTLIEKPHGIGFGWDHQPGDLWERGLVPSILDAQLTDLVDIDKAVGLPDLLSNAKPFKSKLLPDGKDPAFYVNKFLSAFGAQQGKGVLFKDKASEHIIISDELFKDGQGGLKVLKRGRNLHMAQMAEAIKDPDEIWIGVAERNIHDLQGGGKELVLDRKYIRVDPKTGLLAIFELFQNGWTGKTAFHPLKKNSVRTDVNQINKRRRGKLIYQRTK